MQENTNEDEYIAAALCRYGGQSPENLWNFLFFTGYLKKVGERADEDGDLYLKMAVPNKEIKSIYKDSILLWFDQKIEKTDRSPLIRALETGDCEAAQNFNGMINLNESGAMLWRALENGATEEGLTELLLSEYDIDRAAAAADVNEFIGKMKSADLLEL